MSNDSRIQQLLDELFDSDRTPEEVCFGNPELLTEVRNRWRQVCRLQGDLDAIFPPSLPGAIVPTISSEDAGMPQIPGYQVDAVLGRGGMGIVFRARQMRLNRFVALKMVLAGAYAGLPERLRFQREAEAVAGLRHPNVVQIHDIAESDGRPFFTMEYVEGGSLAQKLAGTPQPARAAATLLATLADAVQAAHSCGIVHRDLKPANVLLTVDGIPKISDFGLARKIDGETALTRTGIAVGTPSYMAPEQAIASPDALGPAVDVYALGAILYELLTGRPPFRAETAAETIQQLIFQDPVPPSRLNATVPRDLETICLKCLRKKPGLRYSTAAALCEDLHHFLRGESISARPEGRCEKLIRRVRRRLALAAAIAVCAFLTVALIAGGVWVVFDREAADRTAKTKQAVADAEQAALERAVEADLSEMESSLKASFWPEAKAALERAETRLGNLESATLHRRIEQGTRDVEMVERWETIRLYCYFRNDDRLDFSGTDAAYEAAFVESGFGRVNDDPEVVAARIRVSHIRNFLVAAIDHWAAFTSDASRRRWLVDVVRQADPDPTGWRARANDPNNWKDAAALTRLVESAPLEYPSVAVLVFLERRMTRMGQDPVPFMKRFQQAHAGDFWINLRLADLLLNRGKPTEAIRYYQAALALRPKASVVCNNLGAALMDAGQPAEALEQYQLAVKYDPSNGMAHCNLAIALSRMHQPDAAIAQIQVALRYQPNSAILHCAYGYSLQQKGQHDEALIQHRLATALNPKLQRAQKALRDICKRLERWEEARSAWQKLLETDPDKHDEWYGYAELCLYHGEVEEYRRARQALLNKFGKVIDPQTAERTSRACLLLPPSEAELRQAVALADLAASAVDRSHYQPIFSSYLFVKGLAEYREGKFDQAIATMRGDASRALGPAPRLVLAMTLHRSGQQAEARKTLAAAILSHDWKADRLRDQDGCIQHVLRREAESLILPNLQAFLEGNHQPEDNDERIAFLGACQFTNRWAAVAGLYADAFDAASNRDLLRHRYSAARAAALAGSCRGEDSVKLKENERAKWRMQARIWLRAELADWKKFLDNNAAKATARDTVAQALTFWRNDADLACLRDPSELLKLSADERMDCIAFWEEVNRVFKMSPQK